MTGTPLVHEGDSRARPAWQWPWLAITSVAIAFVLIAAIAGWWFVGGRQAIPDWDRLAELNLAAPAGDAFQDETPWVHLRLDPLRPGEENALRISLEAPRGTPVPSGAASPRIATLTAQPLSGDPTPPETLPLQPDPAEDGWLMTASPLDREGWWRLSIDVDGAEDIAELFLLLPDPNMNGPNVVPDSGSSPEGEAVFRRGMDATTGLQSVRFTQWIADGNGNSSVSEHAVTAGGDGDPPGFTYRAAGGMEAVIIGSTRWIKLPGDLGWQEQEGATVVPPSAWGDEYGGATGFTLLGEETIDGERCQLVAFVAPEVTEPRRRTVAWYLWWVGAETGHVRKEAMVSRRHYMLNQFSDFDAPFTLTPPDDTGTPAAGTPPPPATPAA